MSENEKKLNLIREQVRAKSLSIKMGAPTVRSIWPARYFNRKASGRPFYEPHHELERKVVYSDGPRYLLIKGGEGSGKSVAGIVKVLNRLRRGCDGLMLSPDLPHFKKSLWAEFQCWCPAEVVYKEERYKLEPTWKPSTGFELHVYNELGGISTLYCGGIDDPTGWHGPNVNFAQLDEAHRLANAEALKTIDGRLRVQADIAPPQLWVTSTPKKNYLYDYFGDVDTRTYKATDPLKQFKDKAELITLKTKDNEKNTFAGFAENRRLTLSEKEARVYLDAEWEDMTDSKPFIFDINIWDRQEDVDLPRPSIHDPLIVALDAGIKHDSFGLVAVSPHPLRKGSIAVQAVKEWDPETCSKDYLDERDALDFRRIREEISKLLDGWNIIKLVYDRTELHLMAQDLSDKMYVEPFSQQTDRLVADKQLQDLILQRRVWHRGEPELRSHLDHADVKADDDKGLRIVKRNSNHKIDLAVCLSMATAAIMEFIPAVEGYVATGTNVGDGTIVQQLLELIA